MFFVFRIKEWAKNGSFVFGTFVEHILNLNLWGLSFYLNKGLKIVSAQIL